jgi:iron complex transport system substrate-binding protein
MLRRAWVTAVMLMLCGGTAHAQLTIRDDAGRPLLLREPAERIVTLSPSLTEIAFAAGLGDLVVGVDSLSDYPPEAKKVAQVATGDRFTVEQLANLKPDLVLAWREGMRMEDVDRVTEFGAVVYLAQARSLEDIPRLLDVLGRMTGRLTGAAIDRFEQRLAEVKRANADKPRISAFLEIWNRPLTTISGQHVLSEALEICHAENVFRTLPGSAPKVTFDQVARKDPDVIVGAGSASNAEEFEANWRLRPMLSAVRAGRLVYIESDIIQRPSPRTPDGIEQLCAILDSVRLAAAPASPIASRRAESQGQFAMPTSPEPALPGVLVFPARPATGAPTAGTNRPAAAPMATTVAPAPVPEPAPAPSQPGRRPSQYGL